MVCASGSIGVTAAGYHAGIDILPSLEPGYGSFDLDYSTPGNGPTPAACSTDMIVDASCLSKSLTSDFAYVDHSRLGDGPGSHHEFINDQSLLSRHLRDSSPPQKRPCPGNGYQCPCEDDETCMCERCFTHGRGSYRDLLPLLPLEDSSFSTFAQMPPDFLAQASVLEYDDPSTLPYFWPPGFAGDDPGNLSNIWNSTQDLE